MGRRPTARDGQSAPALVPAPWGLFAIAILGLVAVIRLPEASLLPDGDRPEPHEAQLAIAALGLIVLTGASLFLLGAGLWLPAMIAAAALAAVAAFDRAGHALAGLDPAASLRTTLVVGLALLAVYQGRWVVYMLELF